MGFPEIVGLVVWGTVVGLDLASVGQFMLSRPLVAGTVAGIIVGDVAAGLTVGVILEMFALEVLPFGAARYPDYGLGAVAAVATAAGAPGLLGPGIGVTIGLLVAHAGEMSVTFVRRRTSEDVLRHREAIDSGDVGTIYRVHLRGLGRDTARAGVLTGLGLFAAGVIRLWQPLSIRVAILLSAVTIGVGVGTAVTGSVRIARGSVVGWVWLVAGLAIGTTWVFVR